MFASRAITSTQTGHRCAASAKFISTRQTNRNDSEQQRVPDVEDIRHPKRSLACALISTIFCPIVGFIALIYSTQALRAYNKGFYAEATILYKKSIRWSLITFILGLVIGSIIAFSFFVKAVLSV